MARPRRYLLIAGLLLVAGLVGLTWKIIRERWPNAFDVETADADELARLKTADLSAPVPAPAGPDWPQFRGPNRSGIASADHFNSDWETKSPKVAWKTPCGGGYGSVAVADGRVYVQDRDKAKGTERLVCYTAADGKQLWTDEYPVDYSGKLGGYADGPRATPTVHDGRAYTVGALGRFRCVTLNGDSPPELLWEHDLLAEYAADQGQMQWGFAGSPLVDGDLVIVQPGGKKGAVVAFDRTTGEQKWAVGGNLGGYSSPVVGTFGGVRQVVAVTGDSVVGISLPDGKLLWEHPWKTQFNVNAASPVVAGEYVFISSEYGHGCAALRVDATGAKPVYFKKGENGMKTKHSTAVHRDGFVYGFDGPVLKCMNLREGAFVPDWEAPGSGPGTVTLVGDKLLVQLQAGGLHLYDADPTECRPRGSVAATGPNSWATPAVVGGRIYTRDAGNVVCVDATK